MKRYFYSLAVVLSACLFTACSGDSEDPEPGKDLPTPETVVGTWIPESAYDNKGNSKGHISGMYITGYDFDGYGYMYEVDNPTSSATQRAKYTYEGGMLKAGKLDPRRIKKDGNFMRLYLSDDDCEYYNFPKGSYFRYSYSPNVVPEGVWQYYAWYSFEDETWYKYVPGTGEKGIISIFEDEFCEYYTSKKPDVMKVTNVVRETNKTGSLLLDGNKWLYEYRVDDDLNCGIMFLENDNAAFVFTRFYGKTVELN